jgi:hypothetical protein
MGQPERLEERPVYGQHCPVGDGQCETYLAFERQRVDTLVDHGHPIIVP